MRCLKILTIIVLPLLMIACGSNSEQKSKDFSIKVVLGLFMTLILSKKRAILNTERAKKVGVFVMMEKYFIKVMAQKIYGF